MLLILLGYNMRLAGMVLEAQLLKKLTVTMIMIAQKLTYCGPYQ